MTSFVTGCFLGRMMGNRVSYGRASTKHSYPFILSIPSSILGYNPLNSLFGGTTPFLCKILITSPKASFCACLINAISASFISSTVKLPIILSSPWALQFVINRLTYANTLTSFHQLENFFGLKRQPPKSLTTLVRNVDVFSPFRVIV